MKENNGKHFWLGTLTGIAFSVAMMIIAALIFIVIAKKGAEAVTEYLESETAQGAEYTDMSFTEKLGDIQELVENYYTGEVDDEAAAEAMYRGYISSLGDNYADYYSVEEVIELLEESSGEYRGVGISVAQNAETLEAYVVQVFAGGPAEEAGMLPGDILIGVDGVNVEGTALDEIVSMIKGKEGDAVSITVRRDTEILTLDMERREVQVQMVTCKMLDDQVGFICLTEFEEVSAQQLRNAINDLKSQGMTALVLDLRDNPGGLLDSVTEIADMFLEKGDNILYMEDKQGNRKYYDAETDVIEFDGPMAILVNGNSASASEVLTGALKDHGCAAVVGTQTFGKGIVQSLFTLDDGSIVKFTTAHYYTPAGNDIHGEGITPDVVVEYDSEAEEDVQLRAAYDLLIQELAEKPAA